MKSQPEPTLVTDLLDAEHPPVKAVWVLARPGATTATLFTAVGGKNVSVSLTRAQVLTLLATAAESLRDMEDTDES